MRATWLRFPRRTARIRLTALYGVLFLLFGGVLVAMTYALFEGATEYRTPPIPKVPQAPAIENLQLPAPLAGTLPRELYLAQQQLAAVQKQLGVLPPSPSAGPVPSPPAGPFETRDQQLAQAQHQLVGLPGGPIARQEQLTQIEHQLTQDTFLSKKIITDVG